MIVKPLDGDDPAEVGDAPVMILMIMSRNQMIYFSNPCLLHCLPDAIRVPPVDVGPACVYQDGLACGRDDQRCRAAFNIYEIHLQRATHRLCLLHREAAYRTDQNQ